MLEIKYKQSTVVSFSHGVQPLHAEPLAIIASDGPDFGIHLGAPMIHIWSDLFHAKHSHRVIFIKKPSGIPPIGPTTSFHVVLSVLRIFLSNLSDFSVKLLTQFSRRYVVRVSIFSVSSVASKELVLCLHVWVWTISIIPLTLLSATYGNISFRVCTLIFLLIFRCVCFSVSIFLCCCIVGCCFS